MYQLQWRPQDTRNALPTKKAKNIRKKQKEKTAKERKKTTKSSVNALKETIKENYPQPQQLVIETHTGFHIASSMIYAHLQNMAESGCFNDELNKMLQLNGLLPVSTPQNVNSKGVLNMVLSAGSNITAPKFSQAKSTEKDQSFAIIENETEPEQITHITNNPVVMEIYQTTYKRKAPNHP